MPVRLDTHDPDLDLTSGTTKSDIVAFLYTIPEYGYKPSEVSDHLAISWRRAKVTLKRLYDRNHVGKTGGGFISGSGVVRTSIATPLASTNFAWCSSDPIKHSIAARRLRK